MPRLVAFLRAINVGGHVVPMQTLRTVFEACGFSEVQTFIASGNVLFTTRAAPRSAERTIAARLEQRLGYEVATFVRTTDEIAAILAVRPFPAARLAAARTHCVGFLADPLTPAQRRALRELVSEDDALVHLGREIYWMSRYSQGESEFSNAALERRLGIRSTFRGMNTVLRLSAKHFQA